MPWGAVTSGRGWTADQGTFGIRGCVGWCSPPTRNTGGICTCTPWSCSTPSLAGHGRGGRPPHVPAWCKALERRGLSAVEHRGGLDVRMVDMGDASLEGTADYLAKSPRRSPRRLRRRDVTAPRAPFAILRDALAGGLADDCELWLTWEKVSHNRRRPTWSRNLPEWAGRHMERTDEEIAQEKMHGDDQLVIPAESWPAVRAELGRSAGHRRVRWRCSSPAMAGVSRLHWELRSLHLPVATPCRVPQSLDICQNLATLWRRSSCPHAPGVIGSGSKRSNRAGPPCRR
jgi:hypothetical protein